MSKKSLVEDKEVRVEDKSKTEKKEALKRQIRRGNIEYHGRLYIDDKYKKPGKVLRIDNDDPATRKYLESLGYNIVREDVKVGSGSLSEPSNMGSAVHIEQGINFSQPGILYEIDEDLYEARKEVEAEDNNSQLQDMVKANTYAGQKLKE